jgi:hypothetical protein
MTGFKLEGLASGGA